ncbi:unnamed protein product [Fusarium graminearum]|uniref:Chromosome 2, complete genome n=1 Tax=Gibberella zeae (strain ATCC MYA-4620 / CBS 123657 / FGSC 9075 / NRRL 31084 / PH-1) TaxID=229533 RepID=A0A098DEX1_GIBZE|nr:unnamed protein product [Fusarium graminearum]
MREQCYNCISPGIAMLPSTRPGQRLHCSEVFVNGSSVNSKASSLRIVSTVSLLLLSGDQLIGLAVVRLPASTVLGLVVQDEVLHDGHPSSGCRATQRGRKYHYPYQDRVKQPCDKVQGGLQDYTHTESPNSKEFNVRTGLTVLAVALVIPRTAPMVIKYEGKPGTRPLPGPKWVLGSIQLGSWTDDHDDTFVRD